MQSQQIAIKPYEEKYREKIISVWEKSVRATHHFVSPSDIDYYKQIVKQIDFNSFSVYCLTNDNTVLGFVGVADNKIEMLFLDPDFIGQGLGKKLMKFALEVLKADKVDVMSKTQMQLTFISNSGLYPMKNWRKTLKEKIIQF